MKRRDTNWNERKSDTWRYYRVRCMSASVHSRQPNFLARSTQMVGSRANSPLVQLRGGPTPTEQSLITLFGSPAQG